jgi:hypothetical protein
MGFGVMTSLFASLFVGCTVVLAQTTTSPPNTGCGINGFFGVHHPTNTLTDQSSRPISSLDWKTRLFLLLRTLRNIHILVVDVLLPSLSSPLLLLSLATRRSIPTLLAFQSRWRLRRTTATLRHLISRISHFHLFGKWVLFSRWFVLNLSN